MIHSANMLTARWITPKCRNPLPRMRMYSPLAAIAGGHSAQSRNSGDDRSLFMTLLDCAAVKRKTRTFNAISVYVTIGVVLAERAGAPATVRA